MSLTLASWSAKRYEKISAIIGNLIESEKLQAFCDALTEADIEILTTEGVILPDTMTAGGDPVTGTGKIS